MPVETEEQVEFVESDFPSAEAEAEIAETEQLAEAEIASFGGWEEVEVKNISQKRSHSGDASFVPLLDEDDRVTPEEIQQEHPWWMQPLPRMIVTGSAVTGLLYAMFSMFGLWGSSTEKPSSNLVATDATAIDTEVTARINQLQTENENLRRQQFMGEPLSEQTPEPQQPKPQKSKPKVQQPVSVSPKPKIIYVRTPRPASPRPVTPTQAVTNSRPVASKRLPPTASESATPLVTPPIKQVEPEIEPMERLHRAANVGSYSSRASSTSDDDFSLASNQLAAKSDLTNDQVQSETTDISTDEGLSGGTGTVPDQVTNQLSAQPSYLVNEQVMQQSVFSNDSSNADESNVEQTNESIVQPRIGNNESSNADETNVYQGNQSIAQTSIGSNNSSNQYQTVGYKSATRSLVVGTRAAGKLETPIAWSGQLQNPNQSFLIQLSEPLSASDSTVAVEKGSYLVARVEAATEAGMIQMSAVAILSTVNGRTTEQPLPAGAILILGKGGRPLIAESSRRDRLGSNLGTALLSGAATAASVANQVSSQSVFGSGGSFSSTTTSDDPNYAAGFGQGVAQSLARQMQNRSQRMQQQSDSLPTVFSLNQGTSVQIFVNQSVSF